MKTVEAWHFTKASNRLRHHDNRLVVEGETLTVDGQIKLCKHGLHASVRAIDALKYAPGLSLWRVIVSGDVVTDNDKLVGTSRKAMWNIDATPIILKWSQRVALDALDTHWNGLKLVTILETLVSFLWTGDNPDVAAYAANVAVMVATDGHRLAAAKYNQWLEEMIFEARR